LPDYALPCVQCGQRGVRRRRTNIKTRRTNGNRRRRGLQGFAVGPHWQSEPGWLRYGLAIGVLPERVAESLVASRDAARRILIVDDNADAATSLAEVLARLPAVRRGVLSR
jgi:hypothetical protein